jgi:hypothetical protein
MNFLLSQNEAIKRLEGAGSAAKYADVTGDPTTNLIALIINIINIALSITGVIFLALVVYAGYRWMTAGGDETKVKSATDILKRAVIGIVIVLSAYAIANFVVPAIVCATQGSAAACPL